MLAPLGLYFTSYLLYGWEDSSVWFFDPACRKYMKWFGGEKGLICSCWSHVLVRVHCDFLMPFLSQVFSCSFEYVVAPLDQFLFRAEGKVYPICLFNFQHFNE